MGFEWQAGAASYRFDDHRAHSDIWHKMSIHDVNLDALCSRSLGGLDLFAQAREVRGEN